MGPAVVDDDDDDDDDEHATMPRPPPLPSVDSAESSDVHDDDDDHDDYAGSVAGANFRSGSDDVVISVGSNRKSAYPATPSDRDGPGHPAPRHQYHHYAQPPQPQQHVDLRRTPGPPSQRHSRPPGPSHRLTPGAGAAKFKFQFQSSVPAVHTTMSPRTPQISNLAYDNDHDNDHVDDAAANDVADDAADDDDPVRARERHRQKHLYTPAHVTLSKNPHLHLPLDRDGRADVLSPATIRMTESLDKVLCDEDDDDNEGGGGVVSVGKGATEAAMGSSAGADRREVAEENRLVDEKSVGKPSSGETDVVGTKADPAYFRHVPGLPANPALATPNASNIGRARSHSSDWGVVDAWRGPFPLTAAAAASAARPPGPSAGPTIAAGSGGAFATPRETPKPNRTVPRSNRVGYSPYHSHSHSHSHSQPHSHPHPDHNNPYFVPLNAPGGTAVDVHGPNAFQQVSVPHHAFPQQQPHPHHHHDPYEHYEHYDPYDPYSHYPPQHPPFAPSPPTFPHHPTPNYHLPAPEQPPFHPFPHFSPPTVHSAHHGIGSYGHPIMSPPQPPPPHHPADPRVWSPVPPPFGPVLAEEWHPPRGHPHHHYHQHHHQQHYQDYNNYNNYNTSTGLPGHASPELAFHPIAGHISPDPSTSLSVSPAPFVSRPPYHPTSNHPHPPPHSQPQPQPHPHPPPVIHQPTPVPARHPIPHPPHPRPRPPHPNRNSPAHSSPPIQRGGRAIHTASSSSGEGTERPRKDSLSSISAGEDAMPKPKTKTKQKTKLKSSPRRQNRASSPASSTRCSPTSRKEEDHAGIEACTWMPHRPHVVWTGRPTDGTPMTEYHARGRGKGRGGTDVIEGDMRHGDTNATGKKSSSKPTMTTMMMMMRDRHHSQHRPDTFVSKASRPTSLGAGVRVDDDDDDAKRGEFTETPAERQAFKEFGRNFRQKENESLEAARKYALDCLSATNPDLYLPPTTHWRVYLDLADIAKRSNRLDDARDHYRRSCELQPYASQGWLEHSKLEEECGNLSKCARILREGLQYCSLNESLLIRAVKFYERLGDRDHARQLLARLKHSNVEKSWKTMLEGALLEARAGKYRMARELLKYITFHVPWYGPLYLAHTKLEREYGSPAEAYWIVEKGLKELPRYGPLYFQAFRLCEKEDISHGDFHLPRTMEVVSRADNISKELLWKVHLEAAQIQERAATKAVQCNPTLNLRSELQSARRSYAKAIMLCPQNLTWKVWLASGRTNVSCENIDEARSLFLRAYDCVSEKSKSTVLLECARLEEFCGDVELARSILCKARNESGKNDWKVWLSSVSLESRCGHRERAIVFAQRALNIHSGTGRLWAALIQLKHEDGELQQMKVLRKALQAVPKSGEVWCEGARIYLNPFSPTFDLNAALRHLTFAARFTPQYGDSFLEHIRLDMIDQWLIPLAKPFITTMYNSFLSGGKMQLNDSYQLIAEHIKKAAEEVKSNSKKSIPFDKDVLDTSELELRCSSADPNYGHLWFQCRENPIDTAREVIARARLMMTEDFSKYSFIYVAAMVRRAGILMTIYHCDKVITPPDEKCGQRLAQAATAANEDSSTVNIDAIITSRLRSAPKLEEILSDHLSLDGTCANGASTKTSTSLRIAGGPMFVTGNVTSNRTWDNLSFSEKRQILFGTDSLLN
ncbi:hypothetical protein ACHAXS_008867 [Conticribra weissflogii]